LCHKKLSKNFDFITEFQTILKKNVLGFRPQRVIAIQRAMSAETEALLRQLTGEERDAFYEGVQVRPIHLNYEIYLLF
jgi:hypothetical protein